MNLFLKLKTIASLLYNTFVYTYMSVLYSTLNEQLCHPHNDKN